MNLLEDNNNYNNKKESSAKKTVGILLILSIIALVVVVLLIAIMKSSQTDTTGKEFAIYVNNENTKVTTLTDKEGTRYVALEDVIQSIGYTYYNGEYKGEATEAKENCYVKNDNEIIGFSTTEKTAYKTEENAITEKQYYNLKNTISIYEEKLYISIDDLVNIFNLSHSYEDKTLSLSIQTANSLIAGYKEQLKENTTVVIDESFENAGLVLKNLLVVSKDGKYGVVDTNFKTIIGNKYKTMVYDEYTTDFIVSDEAGRYGVISNKGDAKISLKYDSLYIISYEPLLYAVTKNQQYGVIDSEGNVIVDIDYDALVCKGDERNNINSVVIIRNINGNDDDGIVVCKNSKFGIVNLTNGETILECMADKINSRTNAEGKEDYFVTTKEGEKALSEYIKNANEVTINLPDTNSILNVIY